MIKRSIQIIILLLASVACTKHHSEIIEPLNCEIDGFLGEQIESGFKGRLTHFITDSNSAAICIFHKDSAEIQGSWKGEHAGKWLYAASMAYRRTGDSSLLLSIKNVADFLVHQQRDNGYIGTYIDSMRFYANPVNPRQTWDVWIAGYILKGMLEVAKITNDKEYLDAACRLADLFIVAFQENRKSICNSGCFSGTASAGVIVEFADLYQHTGEKKYLDFAVFTIEELNRRPGTQIIEKLLKEYDMAQIGEGKMYETIRCINGILKVYQHTKDPKYLTAAINAWNDIVNNHLNPAGAPCGGVDIHKECFNNNYMFSPYYNSETCALMEWIVFNKLLLLTTGNGKYASQLERSTYNAVPGARFPDGFGWIYHSVMNGTLERTSEWACCSSSGAIILEEIAQSVYFKKDNEIMVNLYASSSVQIDDATTLHQKTNYPFKGDIEFSIETSTASEFALLFRKPDWTNTFSIEINNKVATFSEVNGYCLVKQKWNNDDKIKIKLAIEPYTNVAVMEYNEKGYYLDGKWEYVNLFVGPLLYGTSHTDNLKQNSTLKINDASVSQFNEMKELDSIIYRQFSLKALNDSVYNLVPYYTINNKVNQTGHIVWYLKK